MSKEPKAKRPKKNPAIVPLVLKERDELTALLNHPVMQKALANAAACKPGVFFVGAGTQAGQAKDAEMATLIANNRLHEIRGWEQFENAIYAQTEEPKPARAQTQETYATEE